MIQRFVASLMLLCITAALFHGGPAASAQAPEPAASKPLVDMSKITDSRLKAVIDEIGRKAALINEVYIEEFLTDDPLLVILRNHPAKCIIRRNGQSFTSVSGLNLPQEGVFMLNDWWMIDTRKLCLVVQQGFSTVEKKKVMLVSRIDVEKLRAAGVNNELTSTTTVDNFFNPFSELDPATLKLTGETPEEWTFTAAVLPSEQMIAHGAKTQTLTVTRSTGFVKKCVTEGQVTVTQTVNKVHINPNPPIPETYFNFTPPPSALVLDMTDQIIQECRMKQQAGQGQVPVPGQP